MLQGRKRRWMDGWMDEGMKRMKSERVAERMKSELLHE